MHAEKLLGCAPQANTFERVRDSPRSMEQNRTGQREELNGGRDLSRPMGALSSGWPSTDVHNRGTWGTALVPCTGQSLLTAVLREKGYSWAGQRPRDNLRTEAPGNTPSSSGNQRLSPDGEIWAVRTRARRRVFLPKTTGQLPFR